MEFYLCSILIDQGQNYFEPLLRPIFETIFFAYFILASSKIEGLDIISNIHIEVSFQFELAI